MLLNQYVTLHVITIHSIKLRTHMYRFVIFVQFIVVYYIMLINQPVHDIPCYYYTFTATQGYIVLQESMPLHIFNYP